MTSTETATPSLAVIDDLDWWDLKYTAVRVALELDIFIQLLGDVARSKRLL
jgi:hypothetical protein